jgi:hypothetical protein
MNLKPALISFSTKDTTSIMASSTNQNNDDSSNKKRKTGLEALSVVLGKQNTEELEALRKENKRLRMLEALQIHKAATQDIHYWFDKINDPNDETSIKTLQEMRDFIIENSVEVDTLEYENNRGPCRFSTIGGCHELMASIVLACTRYDLYINETRHSSFPADKWQWERSEMPVRHCQHQCVNSWHIFREDRSIVAERYYEHIKDFPTVLVEAAAKGDDPTPIAERRRTLRNMGGFHF